MTICAAVPEVPLRAVLFDFFGTLTTAVRRGPRHAAIARSLGCRPHEFSAVLDRTFYQRASGRCGDPVDVLAEIAAGLGAHPTRARLRAAVMARVVAVLADVTLRPDATRVLRELRKRGLRIAVVSDCWYELPRFLPTLPIEPLVDGHVYSSEVGRCKPDPALYLTACAQLRVDPRECLYVGDGGSQELSGARRVGMAAVRVAAADLADHLVFNAEQHWAGATVGSLTDVLAFVERQCGRGAQAGWRSAPSAGVYETRSIRSACR